MAVILGKHQIDAIKKMKNGSILVGGVGSGKSRTSIGYFFKEFGGGFSPVTQSVASGKNDIIGYEISREMKSRPRDLVIITTAKKRDSMEWEQELALYSMSTDPECNIYDNRIKVDSWNNIAKYANREGCFFIFDEQRVGGTGKWAKTFIKIARKNKWILLSATPGDTWSDYAPVFIANNFYRNFTEFRRRHVVYNQYAKFPKIDHYVECSLLEQHRSDILIPMEFKRNTVAHHEYVQVPYNKDIYDVVAKQRWNVYKEQPCKEIAELCQVLRRVVNSDESRAEEVVKIVEKHGRVIIFYNYDYELEILRELFERLKVPYGEWNGKKHQEIPRTKKWGYLVQYLAGAEGWNCIETDCIIFYSQTYSYKSSQQAAGRIDRLNTPFVDLWYYHFMSSAKIDLAINRCLTLKKDFNEKAFADQGGIIF